MEFWRVSSVLSERTVRERSSTFNSTAAKMYLAFPFFFPYRILTTQSLFPNHLRGRYDARRAL